MSKKLFILSLGILLLPSLVFSAVDYSRNPSGYTISNPISFYVSFDDFNEICDESWTWWSFYILSEHPENPQDIFSEDLVVPTTKNHTFVETLPLGIYTELKTACCGIIDEFLECEDWGVDGEPFEYVPWTEGGIFDVVEAPIFTYLEIPAEMPADMLAYAGAFFTDLSLLIVLSVGLPVGFVVIKKVISLVKIR